jgi:hypothetical protein
MKIKLDYDYHIKNNPELLGELRRISIKHGELTENQWSSRAGAIDLVSILEIIGVFAGLKILDGFVEGLVGKDMFVELGAKCRKGMYALADKMSDYLVDLYTNIIEKNKNRYGAFVLIEYINDFTLYIVLNNKKMTKNLIESIPETIALAIIICANIKFEMESPRVIQLYPSFDSDTWDYILMPTTRAFGQYIDRYFDIKERKIKQISSRKEFLEKFKPDDKDDFKFLISANRDDDFSKFDEL